MAYSLVEKLIEKNRSLSAIMCAINQPRETTIRMIEECCNDEEKMQRYWKENEDHIINGTKRKNSVAKRFGKSYFREAVLNKVDLKDVWLETGLELDSLFDEIKNVTHDDDVLLREYYARQVLKLHREFYK
jgi:hypothetical protein